MLKKNKTEQIASYISMRDGLSATFSGILSAVIAEKIVSIFPLTSTVTARLASNAPTPAGNAALDWLACPAFILIFIAVWLVFFFVLWPLIVWMAENFRKVRPAKRSSAVKKKYLDTCLTELLRIKNDCPPGDVLSACIAVSKISEMLCVVINDTMYQKEQHFELKKDNTVRSLRHYEDFRNFERRVSLYTLACFFDTAASICAALKQALSGRADALLIKDLNAVIEISQSALNAIQTIQ